MNRKTVSAITLTLLLASMLTLAFNIQPVKASGTVGVEAGDWIKCTYTISGWPSGTPYPEWLKVEFLSVEGTNATIRVTMRMSDGTEQSDTLTVDVAGEGETFQGLSGFVIPANRTIGDSIYITGYGNVTIAGETTSTYAGASRTVVYASFSQYGTQLTYYWDKQTGVMVEASVVSGSVTATAKATETNMWQAETIYIRVDGSIEPSTAAITTVDNITYTFTGNIYDEIVVERDNIVVDGAGYTVQGTGASGSRGIGLSGRSNVTIKNMIIRYFWEGIRLEYSSNNTISENKVTNNTFGIYLSESNNNSLSGNNVTANNDGIILESSFNNVLRNNNMFNNKYNFGVYGYVSQFVNDVDVSNTVDGKPIYYWVNEADRAVPMDAGCVVLVNSTRITVRNLNLTKNSQGIRLAFTTNSTIAENSIANNDDGIRLEYSSNNSISGNNITNSWDGVYLVESSNDNTISGNNITANIRYGIMLYGYSNNNSISGNNVANSFDGIYLGGPGGSNNSVSENNITANIRCGISLYYLSSNNSISGNYIANNQYGIGLEGSSGNKFYHNNFINNINQVYSSDSVSVWDDGYPSSGNYWSDYVGVDVKSGPGQDLSGSDGIGDAPYIIDANNRDCYPLMNPYGAPPPPTYTLTITTTVGGTTDPSPGTYSYTANSTVQVTAIPNANYLLDHWELDTVNVGSANPYTVLIDKNHKLKAVFSPVPPPLSASISPLSASIMVGQSVTFTSTASGGCPPYSCQWYLNGNPVSGATSNTWTFTPIAGGIYYIYLKVTDAKANTAQSDTARIAVATVPVGGYSFSIQVQTKTDPVLPYIALMATLTAIFTKLRLKTKRKR